MEEVIGAFHDLQAIDKETRTRAEGFLCGITLNEPLRGLVVFAEIIGREDATEQDRCTAMVYLTMIVTPKEQNPRNAITNMWLQMRSTEGQCTYVLNAVMRALSSTSERLCWGASRALGQLFMVVRGNFLDQLREIYRLLTESVIPANTRFAAAMAFKCMFDTVKAPDEMFCLSDEMSDVFTRFVAFVMHVFDKFMDYPSGFVTVLFDAFASFVSFVPPCVYRIEKDDDEADRLLPMITSIGEAMKACPSVELCAAIYRFMFEFIKRYYENDVLPVEPLCVVCASMVEHANVKYATIAIDFWGKIAKHEKEIFDCNRLVSRYESAVVTHFAPKREGFECPIKTRRFRDITGFARGHVMMGVFRFMTRVDPDDWEDGGECSTHVFATAYIQRLFHFNGSVVFASISEIWKGGFIDKECNTQCAMLLMIECMCQGPTIGNVQEFVKHVSRDILTATRNPRLSRTALCVIGSLIKHYGTDILPCLDVLAIARERVTDTDELVVDGALHVVIAVISKVPTLVPEICQIESEIVRIVIEKRPTRRIFERAFMVQERMVEKMPDDGIQVALSLLRSSLVLDGVVDAHMNLIGVIFKRFGPRLQEQLDFVSQRIFAVLSLKNEHFEATLSCLIQVVASIGPAAIGMVPTIMGAVGTAIQSNDHRIIITTLRLLGIMFCSVGESVKEYVNRTIDLVRNVLSTENLMQNKDWYPRLAIALGKIVVGVGGFVDANVRDELMGMYGRIMDTYGSAVDTNESNVEFGNTLCECMFSGYSAIIAVSASDAVFMTRNRTKLFVPVIHFGKLSWHTRSALLGFCEFMRSAVKIMGPLPRCNIALTHKRNVVLLILAECFGDADLTRLAGSIIVELQTRL